mmetsp:Transcript_42393/g.69933  ORF Transcript_42393/g.69933 Transcript_42393/m.69933 type:complete len:228 (+) Transcript_42393:46-729(+)
MLKIAHQLVVHFVVVVSALFFFFFFILAQSRGRRRQIRDWLITAVVVDQRRDTRILRALKHAIQMRLVHLNLQQLQRIPHLCLVQSAIEILIALTKNESQFPIQNRVKKLRQQCIHKLVDIESIIALLIGVVIKRTQLMLGCIVQLQHFECLHITVKRDTTESLHIVMRSKHLHTKRIFRFINLELASRDAFQSNMFVRLRRFLVLFRISITVVVIAVHSKFVRFKR